jgi:hypothetical protein
MHSKTLLNILEKCESACGHYIDMQRLCATLRAEEQSQPLNDATLFARILFNDNDDEETRFFLSFKPNISQKEKNTLTAMLLAKLILNVEKVKELGAEIEAFEYKGMKDIRYSRLMYLATRLALPESEIDKIDSSSLNKPLIMATAHYSEEFVNNAVSGHSVGVLLGSGT